jgi:dynein light intermediate chain
VRAVAADVGILFIHYTQYKLYIFNLHSLTFLTPSPLQKNTDETIRHVAINAAERGVLLLRVRDEIRMVLKAYQTLYESSIAFGMRKSLMAEQKRGELAAKVRDNYNGWNSRIHANSSFTPIPPPPLLPSLPLFSPSQIKLTRAEIAELEAIIETLTAKFDATEVSEKEKAAVEEEKHTVEVEKMKAANATLKDELEAMLAPPRK